MKKALVLYASRNGHTRRIAGRLAEVLCARGLTAEAVDVRRLPPGFQLAGYGSAILASPVYRGQHEPGIVSFARAQRGALAQMPAALVTVSLSQAGVELPGATEGKQVVARADVGRMVEDFVKATGWRPDVVKPVGGALLYTRYNFFIRWIMKRIAAEAGGSTDTSRDHDYTDWAALDRFAEEWARTQMQEVVAISGESR